MLRDALDAVGLPADAVQTVDDFGRAGARHLMQARDYVDVLIPRGSAGLIRAVVDEARVPVIETGAGVVHMFLDASAREDWAVELVHNAKVQRPSVCNALETLLVHRDAAERLLPAVFDRLEASGVTIHADERVRALRPEARARHRRGLGDRAHEPRPLGRHRRLARRCARAHPPVLDQAHRVDRHERPRQRRAIPQRGRLPPPSW